MQTQTITDAIAEYIKSIEGQNIPSDIVEATIKALVKYHTEPQKN